MKTIFQSPKEAKTNLVKATIALIMLISILVTGLVSFHLFREQDYNASSLLILTSYVSIVACVYILSNKKPVLP